MESKSYYSTETKIENLIAETSVPSRWPTHIIRDYNVAPMNTVSTSLTESTILKFPILRRGVLNRLVLKTVYLMNSTDETYHGEWLGLELFEWARVITKGVIMFEVRPSTLLGIIQEMPTETATIIRQAARSVRTPYPGILAAVNYAVYTPFLFGCFDNLRSLPDTVALNETVLEIKMSPVNSLFRFGGITDTTLPTPTYSLIEQFLDFGDAHRDVMAPRYRTLPWIMYTIDQYQENIFTMTVNSGAATPTVTVPQIVLQCPENVIRTFIMVSSDTSSYNMSPDEILSVRVAKNDTVIYTSGYDAGVEGSINESLLLYHTSRRKDGTLRQHMTQNSCQVHVIPWGTSDVSDRTENTIHMGSIGDTFTLDLSFKAMSYADDPVTGLVIEGTDAVYSIFISHEYTKRVAMDRYGLIKVVGNVEV